MNAKNILITILISLSFCACNHNTLYSHFLPVSPIGWQQDSVLTYTFPVHDTLNHYDVIICVRHMETYPYQNMWLFCACGLDSLKHDTIEFFLADDRGKWLGNGSNQYVEMPVLYEQNILFPDTGLYNFTIQHGMRDERLKGVSDIGLIIRQSN